MAAILRLDRRYLYLLMIVLSSFLILSPLGLPLPLGIRTQHFYNIINDLPDGSSAIFQIESGTAEIGVPEQLPALIAVVKHMVSKHFKLVFFSALTIDDSNLLIEALDRTGDFPLTKSGYVYGTDYVNIGWIGGGEPGMNRFATDMTAMKKVDSQNRPLADMPLMQTHNTITDYDLYFIMCREADTPAAAIRQIVTPFAFPAMLITSSSLAAQFQSYVTVGQGREVLYGARGGAEYEKLSGFPGLGLSTVDALSSMAVVVIIFTVLGNVAHFSSRGALKSPIKQSKEVK